MVDDVVDEEVVMELLVIELKDELVEYLEFEGLCWCVCCECVECCVV